MASYPTQRIQIPRSAEAMRAHQIKQIMRWTCGDTAIVADEILFRPDGILLVNLGFVRNIFTFS